MSDNDGIVESHLSQSFGPATATVIMTRAINIIDRIRMASLMHAREGCIGVLGMNLKDSAHDAHIVPMIIIVQGDGFEIILLLLKSVLIKHQNTRLHLLDSLSMSQTMPGLNICSFSGFLLWVSC